jgi:putative CRISPR-associated protein (TIGR02619 family)
MPNIIISTVGTSLLTNQVDRKNPDEESWFKLLFDCANEKVAGITAEVTQIISTLRQRAESKLKDADHTTIRRLSAELNGIYGIYEDNLDRGKVDIHYLIATDTAQGQTTAEIIRDFLCQRNIPNVNIQSPKGLSTSSTKDFSSGVDDLITWLESEIVPMRASYQVYFNLVGGFKSLQGYLNTLGMFYADKIIYIFEGKGSQLITIPRLPIDIDIEQLKPHAVTLALLAEGDGLDSSAIADISEGLIGEVDGKYILSSWGLLIWRRTKQVLLGGKLLEFPGLGYQDKFRADFNSQNDVTKRVDLQETLARVSYLFTTHQGNTQALTGGGLQYAPLKGQNIDHFRVNQGMRVSCRVEGGKLVLYRYGEHEINENPY